MSPVTIMEIYIQDNHMTTYCEKEIVFDHLIPKQLWRKSMEKEVMKMYPEGFMQRKKGNHFILQYAGTTLHGHFECTDALKIGNDYYKLGDKIEIRN